MGRKTTYTQHLGDEIISRVAEGEPLRKICRDMNIAWRTVYEWREKNEEFSARFASARDMGADAIFEETIEIADTPRTGFIKAYKADGSVEVKEEDMLGHRKLQVETRFKLLSKWNPKKYGDRVQQDVVVSQSPREMSIDELQAAIERLSNGSSN